MLMARAYRILLGKRNRVTLWEKLCPRHDSLENFSCQKFKVDKKHSKYGKGFMFNTDTESKGGIKPQTLFPQCWNKQKSSRNLNEPFIHHSYYKRETGEESEEEKGPSPRPELTNR